MENLYLLSPLYRMIRIISVKLQLLYCHEARFRRLMDNRVKNKVFKQNIPVKWYCTNYGYVLEGKETLLRCPASQD